MLPETIKKFIIDQNVNKAQTLSPQGMMLENDSSMLQQRSDINMEAYNAYYNNVSEPDQA